MAQLVFVPPRAAEVNEPVVIVGATTGLATDPGAEARARAPAAPAAAPTPRRKTARRLKLGMRAILPSPDKSIGRWHSRGFADTPAKPE
ncbi:uncharacterized protein RMCFA_1597 [Mycolicibacterium fortuitum subsp. acetamidolyticum]|uniref:Uncharacterized protein n=1 Tax=Mycolicibacterium fortuitum subsp. acetamidolyticum TaxID=144550 RepID=A0A100WMX8_MYCFO|nr:uncharacterized protein RMCFA_1597 [Mycolicibacterium fortuitum subsp. acetamidolyticum]